MSAPHAVLGIRPDATQDEIRTAWRALARRSHPDLAGRSATAEERMKAINAAHDAMLEALVRAKESAAGDRRRRAREAARTVRPKPATGRAAGGSATSSAARAEPEAPRPPCPRPAPERPFGGPQRMVPDAPTRMRMQAALLGRLRQILNRETARLGGAAYAVPGQPGWRDDASLRCHGGLPATHLVTRIDVVGRSVHLRLDARPAPGRILVALPRLRQEGSGRIRRETSATILEIDVPRDGPAALALADADVSRCVAGAAGISVRVVFPD